MLSLFFLFEKKKIERNLSLGLKLLGLVIEMVIDFVFWLNTDNFLR